MTKHAVSRDHTGDMLAAVLSAGVFGVIQIAPIWGHSIQNDKWRAIVADERGGVFVGASMYGILTRLDVQTGNHRTDPSGRLETRIGAEVFSGASDGVNLYLVADGLKRANLNSLHQDTSLGPCSKFGHFSVDGSHYIEVDSLRELPSGKQIGQLPLDKLSKLVDYAPEAQTYLAVWSQFMPDRSESRVLIYRGSPPRKIVEWRDPTSSPYSMRLSPNGKFVSICTANTYDFSIRSIESGKTVMSIPSAFNTLIFSRDSRWVIVPGLYHTHLIDLNQKATYSLKIGASQAAAFDLKRGIIAVVSHSQIQGFRLPR